MDRPLSVLVALVLVSSCEGWEAPEFCHGQQCPEYQLVKKTQDFEERRYVATNWITITAKTSDKDGVIAANMKLKEYCKKHNQAGQDDLIRVDTWPALLTAREGDKLDLTVSWFIPPGTMPSITDESIRLEQRPAATVYVRVFYGTPNLKVGEDNAEKLRQALSEAGITFDLHTYYSGAAYENFFSLYHHNEIWIYAA